MHLPPVSESDLKLIRNSPALSPNAPAGLVRQVWFDNQLCLTRICGEGNHELSRLSFLVKRDEDRVEYVMLSYNPETKNH